MRLSEIVLEIPEPQGSVITYLSYIKNVIWATSRKMMVLKGECAFMKIVDTLWTNILGFIEFGARKKLTIFKLRISREHGPASRKSMLFLDNSATFKTFETFSSPNSIWSNVLWRQLGRNCRSFLIDLSFPRSLLLYCFAQLLWTMTICLHSYCKLWLSVCTAIVKYDYLFAQLL